MLMASDARRRALAAMSEAEFYEQVRVLAQLKGWYIYHPYDSRNSYSGWPDVVLLRERAGLTCMVVAELKREKGKTTLPQETVLALLACVPGVETHVWRPSDFEQIVKILE